MRNPYFLCVSVSRTFVFWILGLAFLGGLILGSTAKGEISAEERRKRELFLRARESIEPSATPTPTAVRPQPRPRPGSSPSKRVAPKPEKPESTPLPRTKDEEKDIIKLPPPRPHATPKATPEEEPEATPTPTPRATATPKPTPTSPLKAIPDAPIVVGKSGEAEDEGLIPPPPQRRGFLGLGGPRYRYLTRSVRAAIDRAPVKRGRWQYIVVHNSGTKQGNARIFDNYHRNVRKMPNGLAYHFVIGNGTSSGNGEIEIGSRWKRQINGGHVASDHLNDIALGICFVGDFNRSQPTTAQLAALEELIRYLRDRVGKSKGRMVIVKAHREINPKPTDCPGNRFPYRWMHRRFD